MSNQKSFMTVREFCATALGAALMTICAWISIPAQVPFTLQTFAVFLSPPPVSSNAARSVSLFICCWARWAFRSFRDSRAGLAASWASPADIFWAFVFSALAVGLITKFFGRSFPVLILHGPGIGALLCLRLCVVSASVHSDQGRHYYRGCAQRLRNSLSDPRCH